MILAFRCFLALLPQAWACYFLMMIRTSGFGPAYSNVAGPLVAALLYAGLPAALPFLGLPWRAVAAGTLGICLFAVAASEGFGLAQEMQVVSEHGATPSKDLVIRRWWPFEHHDIFYVRGRGWSGSD